MGDLDWNVYSASVGVGITDRWEVSAEIPYDDYEFHRDFRVDQLNDKGQGNVRIGTKIRLYGNPGDNSQFAINGFVEVPSGQKEIASDGTGFGVGLDWSVRNWVFNVGYRDPGGKSGSGIITLPDGSFFLDPTRRDVEKQVIAGIGYAGRVATGSTGSPRSSAPSTTPATARSSSRTPMTRRPAAASGSARRRTGPSTSPSAPISIS